MAALLWAGAGPAWADLWYEHYAAAEKALADEQWAEAIDEVNRALEKRGDSGARVRTYGMKVEAYFPYLKLGIAYFHLGRLEAALQAFETEERLGAVTESDSDLAELERYRKLALDAQAAAAEAEQERIRGIVATGLAEATRLEREGRLEEAIGALGSALAVSPEDPKATEALERLRQQLARRQEEKQLEERLASLLRRSKELMGEGSWAEASSLLSQAQDIAWSEEIRLLLDEAQEKLRTQLEADQREDRAARVKRELDEVRVLQDAGDFSEALQRLQSVLALAPANTRAQALQKSLLAAQADAEQQRFRQQTVDQLLAEAAAELAAGGFESALSIANRVLALDAGNATAREHLARAYREINQKLIGRALRSNFPPAIRFVDQRQEEDDGTLAEPVRRPLLQLSGVVIDDSPVEIDFYDSDETPLEGIASSQPVGDLYITEFRLAHQLPAGRSTFRLVASDTEGLSSSSEYAVIYTRPLHRSPWLYGALAAGAVLVVGVVSHRHVRRRKRLLERRFNPYMAGAPVLDEKLFFGRQRLLDRILQTLHNNSLLLHGERRIGKTTMLHQLKRRLQKLQDPQYDFYAVYIDLQGTPEERFFATLAEETFQELAGVLDGLKPASPTAGAYSYRDLVRDLRAILKRLRERSSKQVRLVLLIDEVDELNAYDPRVNQKLRSLFMKSFSENLVAVVSGVGIKRHWDREGSPWYNFFEEIEVAPFRPEDGRELIERPIRGVFKLEDGVVERILEFSKCRPYRIQRICIKLVNRMHESERRRIELADVEEVGELTGESSR